MEEQQKINGKELLNVFKNFENGFLWALDWLEEHYYLMDDSDLYLEDVKEKLEEYRRIPIDECEIEARLVEEYEFAKKAKLDEKVMDKIYNKIRVTVRRNFNNESGGILYAILADDGKL